MAFAFKIDKALRANLYKICRLCGIDRDEKVPILNNATSEVINLDDELELYQKIDICLGLKVFKDDKMPQSICILCMDKVNDFYEFREMCFASNAQTRKLLGLKCDELKKKNAAVIVDIKPDIEIKDEPKRPRKRKADDVTGKTEKLDVKDEVKKQKLTGKTSEKIIKPKEEIKDEPLEPASTSTVTSSKARQVCNLCNQRFNNKAKLEQHQAITHVPNIVRYVCTACNETIKKTSDIKNHQLWHKLSKTPYICALCGESLMSTYAYSRHLKDHSQEMPAPLLVLDRECPQCHETYTTNFLYNIHACAVRTKKCAGCNRQQRSEAEYVRHAATCAKSYLNYSKHIPAAAVAAESCVRIKNENDVEEAAAAEAFARHSSISLDMTPIVSLTRLSSPLLSSANHCGPLLDNNGVAGAKTTTMKKGTKKGVSKKDLKRVDDLLKSTIDAFVSIKHEPEVHVETDVHPADTECDGVQENESLADDFHHGDDDDDDADDNLAAMCSVTVKLEELDGSYKDNYGNVGGINIKKEVIDVDDAEEPANKMPMLKLKIKKEHGQLNSSLVDDECNKSDKKKKKKKRKEVEKIKEKTVDKNQNSQESLTSEQSSIDIDANVIMPQPGIISIKQEHVDDDIPPPTLHIAHPEATVMTSIPRMQFQIACISGGVEFSGEAEDPSHANAETPDLSVAPPATSTSLEEQVDVKPNRMELDRMLQITNVSSGVDMNEDAVPALKADAAIDMSTLNTTDDATTVDPNAKRSQKSSPKKPKKMATAAATSTAIYNSSGRTGRGKAFKSTAGVPRAENGSDTNAMPLIVAVSSGSDVLPIHEENKSEEEIQMAGSLYIKPEPRGRGYSDEVHNVENMDCDYSSSAQYNGFMIQEMDEQTYINSIDFNNVQIKQEKDIEVSEVQLSSNDIVANASPNGFKAIKRKRKYATKYNRNESQLYTKEPNSRKQSEESEAEEDVEEEESELSDDDDDDDDEEDANGEPVEEEVREYRELEMPPPLITETDVTNQEKQEQDADDQIVTENRVVEQASNTITPPTFMITNVCSQAAEIINAVSIEEPQTATVEDNLQLKIDSISSGCTDLMFDNMPSTEVQNEVAAGEDINAVVGEAIAEESKVEEVKIAVAEKAIEIMAQREETLKAVEIEMEDVEENPIIIAGEVHEQVEATLKAQPFFETTPTTSNAAESSVLAANSFFGDDNPIEEQQNLLNHQMAEHSTNLENNIQVQSPANPEVPTDVQADTTTITALQLHPYLEDISSSSGSVFECASLVHLPSTSTAEVSVAAKVNNEETDNIINEHQQQQQQQQQQEQQQDPQELHAIDTTASVSITNRRSNLPINHHMLLDDSNINEIAENNNNANIERELQDDVAAVARLQQEQQQQQQQQHNYMENHDINS